MKIAVIALLMVTTLLTACKSLDGTYSPACMAYAGDSIELAGGHYTWDKFTDQVMLGADGKVKDQFPGYPARGSYSVDGETLILTSDAGDRFAEFHLRHDGERLYLMTGEQQAAWQASGSYPNCVLVRGGHDGSQ